MTRPRRVLKGRARALAATSARHRHGTLSRWAPRIALAAAILVVAALAREQWRKAALPDPAVAAVEADSAQLGGAIGIGRIKTRRCSGAGQDAECIDQLEDLGPVEPNASGGPMDAAAALERVDAFRPKTNDYYETLEGL